MAFIYAAIGWLIGIWAASRLGLPLPVWGAAAVAFSIITFASISFRKESILITFVAITAFSFGGLRYLIAQPTITPAHAAYYNDGGTMVITGLIADEPEIRDRTINLRLRAETALINGQSRPLHGDILLKTDRFPVIPYGSRVTAVAPLQTPPEFETFSYKEYLAREQIHSIMNRADIEILETGQGNPLYHAIYAFKAKAQTAVNQYLPSPQSSLLSAILLGNRHEMPKDIVEEFQVAGAAHLLAVSGIHAAILIGVLVALTRPFFSNRTAIPLILIVLGLYTLMVGASASVMRAAIMGSIYLIATSFSGRSHLASVALTAAAFAITLLNPLLLWDVGFQLSFTAVLGLLLYAKPLIQWAGGGLPEHPLAPSIKNFLITPIAIMLAVQILTTPLLILYFGRWSLVSLPVNMLIIGAQPPALILGGASALLGMAIPALGQFFGWLAWIPLSWTLAVVRIFAALPGASLYAQIEPSGVLIIYALIGLLTWWHKVGNDRRKRMQGAWGENWKAKAAVLLTFIAAILAMRWAQTQPDGMLHVAFLDVGQGDATFIQTPSGRQILIDGGLYPTVISDGVGRQMPFGDRTIDILIATHPDADHISGLPTIFDRYDIDLLLTNGDEDGSPIMQALNAAAQDTPRHTARTGETILIEDGVWLEVLHPSTLNEGEDRNNQSVVLRLLYGDFSVLLTGDAEAEAEGEMVRGGWPLSSIVYKVGHHGSNTSSTPIFLQAMRPQIGVISAGVDNSYGHPHTAVLERLTEAGITILRTDELGTIELITDGKTMWWTAGKVRSRQ